MRLRLRRGRRRQRLEVGPRLDHHRGRGQRHRRRTSADWTPATFDLSAYAGKTIDLRLRYPTDGAVQGQDADEPGGIFVDDIALTAGGSTLLERRCRGRRQRLDAERLHRRRRDVDARRTRSYYIASNREYVSYDKYLKTGPYNFGFPNKPDCVEHFPYQDGLLISLLGHLAGATTTRASTRVRARSCPIDAHPRPIYNLDGEPWRPRIQMYDAPFGLQKADSFTLHIPATGNASYIRGQAGNPLFDDTNRTATSRPTCRPRRQGRRKWHQDPGAGGEGHLGEDPHRHPGGHPVTEGTRPRHDERRAGGSPPARRRVRRPRGCRERMPRERMPRSRTPGAPRHPRPSCGAQIQLGNHIRQRQCS